ncbi:TPA: hypothetical protein ACN30N_003695 [Vibrio campbellii]
MTNRPLIVLSVALVSASASAIDDETLESLESRQFKIECESQYGGKRYTWANEPGRASEYFLFGPNARMRDKGIMDLGAYHKVSLKYVGPKGYPQWNKYKLDFSSVTYGSEDKRLHSIYYYPKEREVTSHSVTLSSDGKQIKSVFTEKFYNCVSLGL